jgi:hypothetical protein
VGEILPSGRYFWALGAFFSEKHRSNDLGAFFKLPKIHLNKPYILATIFPNIDQKFLWKKVLFNKAPFWAIFGQFWALLFTKRLVTLLPMFTRLHMCI